jgi:hypothetical protein
MPNKSYLPKKDSELVTWTENFVMVLNQHGQAWGIPAEEVRVIQVALDTFKSLHTITKSPEKTSVIVAQKNEARTVLTSLIRGMVDFRLKNPIITNDQLIALGLHVKDKTPTTIPPPSTRPYHIIKVVDSRRIEVDFQDEKTTSKAKPYGCLGAVVYYAVLATPPTKPESLTRTVLATRTPHKLEFTEEERGKTVYIALRWQNEKGQLGPWSEILSAIIP